MISHPFPLLRQFSDVLDIYFLTKGDNVNTDEDIARISGSSKLASLWQRHGNEAVIVEEPTSRMIEADALATNTPGLTLTIRFADCQNFVLFAPALTPHPPPPTLLRQGSGGQAGEGESLQPRQSRPPVVALIHAGWRGMCKHVIASTVNLLSQRWFIDASEIWVASGPSLCTACADFSDPENEAPELHEFIKGKTIDLRGAAMKELLSLGIEPAHIEFLPGCTRHEPEKYWTYRGGHRDQVKKGYTNCLAVTLRNGKLKIEN